MKDLNYQLSKLCRDNRDGGFSTQATRSRILDLIANQLQALGFRRMQSTSLKPKHVDALHEDAEQRSSGIFDITELLCSASSCTAGLWCSAARSHTPQAFLLLIPKGGRYPLVLILERVANWWSPVELHKAPGEPD